MPYVGASLIGVISLIVQPTGVAPAEPPVPAAPPAPPAPPVPAAASDPPLPPDWVVPPLPPFPELPPPPLALSFDSLDDEHAATSASMPTASSARTTTPQRPRAEPVAFRPS